MCPGHHDVVVVAARRFGEHVVGGLDSTHHVDDEVHLQAGGPDPFDPAGVGGADGRDPALVTVAHRDERDAVAVGGGGVALVEEDHADGAGGGGVLSLELECAGRRRCGRPAPLDQRDVARREPGEIGGFTSTRRGVPDTELDVDRCHRCSDVARLGLLQYPVVRALHVRHLTRRGLCQRGRAGDQECVELERLDRHLVAGGRQACRRRSRPMRRSRASLRLSCPRWHRRSPGTPPRARARPRR